MPTSDPSPSGSSAAQAPSPGHSGDQATPPGQEIDVQALADKVFKLLKQELRLERERRGQTPDTSLQGGSREL